jgi:uncharacterized protein DUF4406
VDSNSGGKRIYIAGPINGVHNGNREAFAERAKLLASAGYEPVNPWDISPGVHQGECIGDDVAVNDEDGEHRYGCLLRADIEVMMFCDGVSLLDGWDKSRGASTEKHVADSIGLPIIEV